MQRSTLAGNIKLKLGLLVFVFTGAFSFASITNSVPFVDSFESYQNGEAIAGSNGWYGVGRVTNQTYNYDIDNGYPLSGPHSQILRLSGGLTNQVSMPAGRRVWVDLVVGLDSFWDAPNPPAVHTNANMSFYVNPDHNLVLGHAEYGNQTNLVWTELTGTDLDTNTANRIAICLDYKYQDQTYNQLYYSVILNGRLLTHPAGRTTPSGAASGGAWFPMTGRHPLAAFSADGAGFMDDFSVKTNAAYATLSISDAEVEERNYISTNADFNITLSHTSAVPVFVDYSTFSSSATAQVDYSASSGTLIIPNGDSGGKISVPVLPDKELEATETFNLTLSNLRNVVAVNMIATGTINDDETVPEELLAYEGFDYGAGSPLTGLNSGSGWEGAWSASGFSIPETTLSGLSFGNLGASGLAVKRPGTVSNSVVSRRIGDSLPQNSGAEIWIGFLLRANAEIGANDRGFAFGLASADLSATPSDSTAPELSLASNAVLLNIHSGGLESGMVVDFDGNYDGDTDNNASLSGIPLSVTNLAGDRQYTGKAFSTTTEMTPAEGYSGPKIYGGYSASNQVGVDNTFTRDRVGANTWDGNKENIYIRTSNNGNPGGAIAVLFESGDSVTLDNINYIESFFNNNPDDPGKGDPRYLFEDGAGNVWISQEKIAGALVHTNISDFSWATYQPQAVNGVAAANMRYGDAITSSYSSLAGTSTVVKIGWVINQTAGPKQGMAMQSFKTEAMANTGVGGATLSAHADSTLPVVSSPDNFAMSSNTTYYLALKIVLGSLQSDHSAYLYNISPDSLASEPVSPVATLDSFDLDQTTLDRIVCYDSEAISLDEIRLGTAYEVLGDVDDDGILDVWEVKHFGNITNANANSDGDGDGFNDRKEYLAGTNPSDILSKFRVKRIGLNGSEDGLKMNFSSASNRLYCIYSKTNLLDGSWELVDHNISATPPENSVDLPYNGKKNLYYRIMVQD